MSAPHRDCESLTAFVSLVTVETCDVYGFFPLRKSRGERTVYVGRPIDANRPYEYLDALAASDPRASLEFAPGRLAHLLRVGFRYYGDALCFLRGVPLSTKSAAALAVESLLGEGRGIGGLLALDLGADGLHDACKLMRWHDADKCFKCGRGGHGRETAMWRKWKATLLTSKNRLRQGYNTCKYYRQSWIEQMRTE